jgi:hypothetical protein
MAPNAVSDRIWSVHAAERPCRQGGGGDGHGVKKTTKPCEVKYNDYEFRVYFVPSAVRRKYSQGLTTHWSDAGNILMI